MKANLAQLRFHPIAILDASSNGNRYSSRAANAALCASDVSVDFFVAYHRLLYGKDKSGAQVQPSENGNGRSDTQLIAYATQAGLPPAQAATFGTCVRSEQHKALVEAMTEQASVRGVTGTPTIFVNGRKVTSHDLKTVQAAIAKADANGPAPQPSTPSSVSPVVSPSVSPVVTPSVTSSPTPSTARSAKPSSSPTH